MDDNFYDNDFEKFLQQQVKHHRMYPSDAVWKGIYKQMHGNRKWPGLYFFAILTVAALTICTLFIESKPIIYAKQQVAVAATPIYDQLDPVHTTQQTIKKFNQSPVPVLDDIFATTAIEIREVTDPSITINDESTSYHEVSIHPVLNTENIVSPAIVNNEVLITAAETKALITADKQVSTIEAVEDAKTEMQSVTKNPTDEYLEQHPEEADRILNQQIRKKPSKWQMQFYITPSLNYRQIVDKNHTNTNFYGPVANNTRTSANKVMRYKPGMGIEIGFGALYSLSNRIKIKTAFQYNIRQFNIEAYSGGTELARISNQPGNNTYAITRFRSSGVDRETELINKYHQLSIPVGLEYALLNSKRVGIQIGGTIQPTYTFSQSAYLLTSDYKSYANGKDILRNWNVNSTIEANFSLKAKSVEWKFGPQLRYQHLPTYSDQYNIKEYLIDYGFRIGFAKTIQ